MLDFVGFIDMFSISILETTFSSTPPIVGVDLIWLTFLAGSDSSLS